MIIRPLDTPEEFRLVEDLEIIVWGLDPREAVPSNIMRPITIGGGVVLGALEDDDLIGMAFGFPARRAGQWVFWSHMTAVHPEYQGRDIGFQLKQAQRRWALEQGYRQMRWTFDPLQRGNANFNLHRLGVHTNTYHENFYGQMHDAINAGRPSDRLEVVWELDSTLVQSLAEGGDPRPARRFDLAYALLSIDADDAPRSTHPAMTENTAYFAEIPYSINALEGRGRDLPLRWRFALRQALQAAFGQGFWAVDFIRTEHGGAYVLIRE